MQEAIHLNQLNDLPGVARELLSSFAGRRIIAFYGAMGAGKTTLIKAICMELGVRENTSSPTYALMNEYLGGRGERICHFDFYRIKTEQEALDMGFEEYLDSGSWCFIEWPEKVESLLPDDCIRVNLLEEEGQRRISFRP